MQIARSFVPGRLAGWIVWPKPEPLAALEDTVEIAGRMDAQGNEVRPIDDADIRAALEALKAQGIEALTLSLINAYLNGTHELRVAELAAEILPNVPLSLSHVVLPEMQEYERTLTTVANAAVRPIMRNYVRNLRTKLRDSGMTGSLSLLRSDGGLMSSEKAEEHPVSLLMSGPAGGVTGALWVGKNAGIRNILTLDVGGTSTDVALIENLEARRVRTTEVGHLAVRTSEEHHRLFTFNMETAHELVNLRAVALGPLLDLKAPALPEGEGDPIAAKLRDHELWTDGAMRPAVIYDRSKLRTNDVIPGPAIIVEMDSTTLIEGCCTGIVESVGNILINLA